MQTPASRRRATRRRVEDARATAARFLVQRKRELQRDLEQRTRELAEQRRPEAA